MTLHKPDRGEGSTVIAAAVGAELVVVIAIFLGAAITVNGHALWVYIVGMLP